ncbi:MULTISPECIES: hypothetical protein [Myxococcus]|uniref:hypothetical protein n=1 Tax=Myxococcus TaxID=32 RepID=UPI0013D079DB|nr:MULTISPECIES: hypothetical protein [Myxococcus]NVJ19665.1 hypothetical protein [Myxococcus sp. AM011]
MPAKETRVLLDTIDFLAVNTQSIRLRDQHHQVHAGIALLDRHQLWRPVGANARRASAAIVGVLVQTIYNLFGDAHNEPRLFRLADKQCGKECARIVEAFQLQRHRRVKEFWTYSRSGLNKPIAD